MEETREIIVENFIGIDVNDAKKYLTDEKITFEVVGEGDRVKTQFPIADE